ncbi:hypothetical protein T458_00470 [Brevibacillus panacihumi W25]|uniref:Solute-binding protein family 5 domain-containing protein n=1 Tax=Brevibacillus panacihumi W25 TaxID=1408254 RepID=V6MEQ8_9BACL|nr:ABC transporter substrate-binding protein [Brevibacillus panacihumi]EST56727.1 hypothetical protein T458_00470 [Brevibacillus panacihumi W25]
MKRTCSLVLSVAISMVLLISGCSQSTTSQGSASNGNAAGPKSDISVVLTKIGNNLDPAEANSLDTSTIMYHVYDTFIKFDNDFNIIPGVAKEWSQPDNRTIEFTIGEGYKFHNGDPMTIEDVVFSVERLAKVPKKAAFMSMIKSVEGSGNKVTVKLTEPNSGAIRNFGDVFIVSKKYLQEAGEKYANAPIGTGPYTVTEYVPGSKVVLKAWADYPFDKAKIETITFKAIEEASAKYIAVETGDADFAGIGARDKSRAKNNEKLAYFEGPSTFTGFVAMNTTKAPFDNVNIRRAMAYAYNNEGISAITPGKTIIDSMVPKMFSTYHSSPNLPKYDLQKAKELLEKEGFHAGNPLHFTAWTYQGNDPELEAFQAELKTISVEMDIQNLEFGVFLEKMANKEYQLLVGGWSDTTGNTLSSLESYWSGSFGQMNITFYTNPKVEELYAKVKAATSEAEMKEAAKEIQDIAAQDVPMIPTATKMSYYAMNKNLENVHIHTSGLVSFRNASIK